MDSVASGLGDTCEVHFIHQDRVNRAREMISSDSSVQELAQSFKILGDATRIRILLVLSREDLCVCDLAALLGMSESAISHQLRILRQARLVRCRRAGKMVYYSQHDQHVRTLITQGLEHLGESMGGISI